MSKVRNIIYRPDTCNLQRKTILFPDQGKLLKQIDGSYTCAFCKFQ